MEKIIHTPLPLTTVCISVPVSTWRRPDGVNILFFHGNGEIVADYDDLGPLYNKRGINFLAADYRGYGRSNGQPTVGAMMADSHIILQYAKQWLQTNAYGGPLVVMGRSLGSAPALELAAAHGDTIAGLIIESGFALATPLLRLLGVDVARIGFNEDKGFGNLDKIRRYKGPTLIIHAQHDHIIPFSDGQALHDASGSAKKRLLRIDHADHNDIFYRAWTPICRPSPILPGTFEFGNRRATLPKIRPS
jgi:fermentation-respiration switch protein FrsA (DUF1100 family)